MQNLTEEQQKEVQERIDKVRGLLKENNLDIGISPAWNHRGNGEYTLAVVAQFVDLKYKPETPKTDAPAS